MMRDYVEFHHAIFRRVVAAWSAEPWHDRPTPSAGLLACPAVAALLAKWAQGPSDNRRVGRLLASREGDVAHGFRLTARRVAGKPVRWSLVSTGDPDTALPGPRSVDWRAKGTELAAAWLELDGGDSTGVSVDAAWAHVRENPGSALAHFLAATGKKHRRLYLCRILDRMVQKGYFVTPDRKQFRRLQVFVTVVKKTRKKTSDAERKPRRDRLYFPQPSRRREYRYAVRSGDYTA